MIDSKKTFVLQGSFLIELFFIYLYRDRFFYIIFLLVKLKKGAQLCSFFLYIK